jgi:colanic acid biosynthesis glycosyl transferase WcaI
MMLRHQHIGLQAGAGLLTIPPVGAYQDQRILLVGINYAPEHSGIAPYTTAAAEHLAAVGNDVLVLTGVPHYPSWHVSDPFRWRLLLEEHSVGVRIRRLRHYVPSKQSAFRRAVYEATFGAQVLAQRLPWRPDAVLAVVPSLLGATAAAKVARHHGAPLGIWVQDLMGHAAVQSGIPGGASVARLAGQVERRLLAQAAAVAVISGSFRSHIEHLGVPAARVYELPNWCHVTPPCGDRARTRLRLGWPEDTTIALHAGNMGLKQGLENVVDAARIAAKHDKKVRFVLLGDGSQQKALRQLGANLPTLEFRAPVPHDEFGDVLGAADILVVNERVGVMDMSLPSKLTSYFLAGRPIVAAVNPVGETAREIEATGAGRVVQGGYPERLLKAILELANDRGSATRLGAHGQRHVSLQLGADAAAHRLTRFLEAILSNSALGRTQAPMAVTQGLTGARPPSVWR